MCVVFFLPWFSSKMSVSRNELYMFYRTFHQHVLKKEHVFLIKINTCKYLDLDPVVECVFLYGELYVESVGEVLEDVHVGDECVIRAVVGIKVFVDVSVREPFGAHVVKVVAGG